MNCLLVGLWQVPLPLKPDFTIKIVSWFRSRRSISGDLGGVKYLIWVHLRGSCIGQTSDMPSSSKSCK
eukprot:6352151-Amphidinium_carterae.3